MCGYSTDRAAPVAIAASTAEPPARSASTPAEEASACGETTMPRVAIVGGLPVWMGNTARSGSRRAGQQAVQGLGQPSALAALPIRPAGLDALARGVGGAHHAPLAVQFDRAPASRGRERVELREQRARALLRQRPAE